MSYNTSNFAGDGVNQNSLYGSNPPLGSTGAASTSGARLSNSGLTPGATGLLADAAGSIFNINFNGTDGSTIKPEDDWRVRISLARATADLFYNRADNSIMYPLSVTNGVIFPYTPSITVSHAAKYGTTSLTHSNYASYFYESSEVSNIDINAEFTVQNIKEGQYLMAVIQFFRTVTKMFFGADVNAGSPPPLVFLDGFGPAYLPHVPCVVKQFTHTMPSEVDYVSIPVGAPITSTFSGTSIGRPMQNFGGPVRLPTASTVTISLQPVYSRQNIARNFTLDKFSRGALIQNGNSPIGGFL
jgi:hypothetical protein